MANTAEIEWAMKFIEELRADQPAVIDGPSWVRINNLLENCAVIIDESVHHSRDCYCDYCEAVRHFNEGTKP